MGSGTYQGHEISGVISEVGSRVSGWNKGERVVVDPTYVCGRCYACRSGRHCDCALKWENCIGVEPGREKAGGFARYVKVSIPEWRLHHLPDEVSFEEGALIEPLACSLHAVKVSGLKIGEQVMVLGAGPIGLGVVTFLKYAGAGLIIVSEINEKRAKLAKRLGADYVFNPQKTPDLKEKVFELTNGKGVDLLFDCSGSPQAFLTGPEFIRYAGRMVLVGIIEEEVTLPPAMFVFHELQLLGIIGYGADGFPTVIELLKKGVSPVREMITSRIKLRDIEAKGFNVLNKPGHSEIKILVEPDE
jgi:(R,R)-butanediol dehydrogenase/meso-butanediol dehydrogenase/diacetyl reductase